MMLPPHYHNTLYFICNFRRHCLCGMKVKIDVMSNYSSLLPAPANGPNATNTSLHVPISAVTSVQAMGFSLAILLLIPDLIA